MQGIGVVETYASWRDIAQEWALLEERALVSGYQTRRWVAPWLETSGVALGVEPLFLLARDEGGAPAVLFALTIQRDGPIALASYAGGRDSNINMPLIREGVALDAAALRHILKEGARSEGIDAYTFYNQPAEWRGVSHPLSRIGGQPSPSLVHSTQLPSSGRELLARMSGDARKRMRWRLRKLEECGTVSFIHAKAPDEIRSIVAAYREQKKIRLKEIGAASAFDIDATAAFLEEAALADEPGVELQALIAGDRVAAMYGGVVHDGCYHAMVNSYGTSPEIARTSPGEVIIICLLQSLCERGIREFDLGVGEAAYKDKWCDRHEALFDTLYGVTSMGKAYVLALGAKQRAKRTIKQSEWLWPLAKKMRAALGRKG